MALLMKIADGDITTIKPKNGTDFTAEEIHEYVGGFFEFVYCKDGTVIAVDEEGKLKSKDLNPNATTYAQMNCEYPFRDYIAGDALVMFPGEVN